MSGDSLAATLQRLSSCQEAADLIYSKDAAQTLADATPLSAAATDSANSNSSDAFSLVIARRIGTMVARLNDLASPTSQVVLTPRMVLCELMDVVCQALYTSLPPAMQEGVSLADKAAVMRQFNLYASTRQIPLKAAAEGLYVVSYVSVKLRVELVALQLRQRIQAELQKKDTRSSEDSVAALVVTETLLEDFMTIYNNIVLTLPITKAASAGSHGRVDTAAEEAAAATADRLAPVFLQYFYQLCDWVLVLESTMKGPVVSYTQVKRLSVEEQRGTVVVDLHRPTPETAWGLLLNEQGCLVDIDVSLRVFEKAKELHRLLQSTPRGAHITHINHESIPPVRQGNYAAYTQRVMEKLQSATVNRKTVRLVLQSSAFKAAARSMPTEVAFVAPPQGGEGTSGQRVTLVLRRQSTAADWGFSVDDRLYWSPPPTHVLSDAARSFVKDYGKHLRLLAVNGVEALHATQVELLTASAETVVLELLVMPSFAESQRAPLPPHTHAATFGGTDDAVVEDKRAARAAKGRMSAATQHAESARADATVEAAVAKLILQSHPDTKATPLSGSVVAAVAMETPLVDAVMERPSPAAAASTAVTASRTAAETPKRLGRPRKATVGAADGEDKAEADAAGDVNVAEEKSKTKEEEEEEEGAKAKAKRSRPRKSALANDAKAATAADATAQPRNGGAIDVNDAAVQNILAAFADTAPRKAPASKITRNDADTATTTTTTSVASTATAGRKRSNSSGKRNEKDEDGVEAASAEKAAPLVFDNGVRLLRLTEEEMVLERPSTDVAWGLPVGRIANTAEAPQQLPLRLLSLPRAKTAAAKTHPFVKHFKKAPKTWFIAEVNGQPSRDVGATLKSIAKLTRMTLRFLRK